MTLGFNSKWSNKLLIQLPSVLIFSQLVYLISYSWLISFLNLAGCLQVSIGLPLNLLLRRDSDKMRFPRVQTILHSQVLENSAVPSAVGVVLHLLLLPLLLPFLTPSPWRRIVSLPHLYEYYLLPIHGCFKILQRKYFAIYEYQWLGETVVKIYTLH